MSLADFIEKNLSFSPPHYITHYVAGQTPISTSKEVGTALVSYLAIIFGIQEFMKTRQPLKLNTLFRLHNVVLTLGSGLLLACMVEEVVPLIRRSGLFGAACSAKSWTPRLEFYYIINYYFKYFELLDTVFLVLKKKPLAFLHVYHHAATAFLCFTQLNGRTSISWVVISINLAVHVLMYYYYYATAGGKKLWWKKYLTTMQITQFVIDLFAVYFGTYSRFAAKGWNLPHMGDCAGTQAAALFGCGVLTSYLFLFIKFYIDTYKKKPAVERLQDTTNGVANGTANGHA
ncbi:GNS1/SUR4 membrane protein [Thelephora ganbajun]|uniref:GNS1/SUR4 membrane protein n=1 Tax=Thelephora ganbajun TaxID=370292 RepID=A0ACB6ZR52_THEGA|nr:GNS1/SUR4 membrane protein [Thelephora ganbajun]